MLDLFSQMHVSDYQRMYATTLSTVGYVENAGS